MIDFRDRRFFSTFARHPGRLPLHGAVCHLCRIDRRNCGLHRRHDVSLVNHSMELSFRKPSDSALARQSTPCHSFVSRRMMWYREKKNVDSQEIAWEDSSVQAYFVYAVIMSVVTVSGMAVAL